MHNRHSRSLERMPYDLEIERTIRQLRRTHLALEKQMHDMALQEPNLNRTLMDYSAPFVSTSPSCIVRPPITANHFELKQSFIQMLPSFCGNSTEDPNLHIKEFLEISEIVKINGLQSFFKGLNDDTKRMTDLASGRAFMQKTVDEASQLINTLATNTQQWGVARVMPKRVGVHEINAFTSLAA
ncbi:hypothetical protein LWI28_024184 [Acer negundo]|uniref:Uncharacterized protein n=1 Tax=Acer negundo TaxID=4023 RepID=A0AAD5P2V2_ACENE|nr:hypothetical protein LWI28_024184 [Acer negundo]